jgi:hypothetical protein
MLQRVAFVSVYQARKLAGRSDTAVISIHDRHFSPALRAGFADVLTLEFDDHDDDRDGRDALADKFTPEQAARLRAWVTRIREEDRARGLLVHCNAGISRSAAVAWWVHREFEVPLCTRFPAHHLNRHVLRLLNPGIAPPPLPDGAPGLHQLMSRVARVFDEDGWPWKQDCSKDG